MNTWMKRSIVLESRDACGAAESQPRTSRPPNAARDASRRVEKVGEKAHSSALLLSWRRGWKKGCSKRPSIFGRSTGFALRFFVKMEGAHAVRNRDSGVHLGVDAMQKQTGVTVGPEAPILQQQQQHVANQGQGERSDASRLPCAPDSGAQTSGAAAREIASARPSQGGTINLHGSTVIHSLVNQQIVHNNPQQPSQATIAHTDRILAAAQGSHDSLRSELLLTRQELVSYKRKVDELTEELQNAKRQRDTPAGELSSEELVSYQSPHRLLLSLTCFPLGLRSQLWGGPYTTIFGARTSVLGIRTRRLTV